MIEVKYTGNELLRYYPDGSIMRISNYESDNYDCCHYKILNEVELELFLRDHEEIVDDRVS